MNTTGKNFPFGVGEQVYIRSVTYHYVGRVGHVGEAYVTLEDASWIADSGRMSAFLSQGRPSESERYQDPVVVFFGGMVDATLFAPPLPSETI